MSEDHYFSAHPASPEERRQVAVTLAGRQLTVAVARGVFSADRLDKGTAVLLDEVPQPPAEGAFLDLGCGWGPLAITMALLSPDADIYGVDVNERALDLLRVNADSLGLRRLNPVLPHEVPDELGFDLIWSNPPIRIGKPALHELLRTWLPRLRPGGAAYLVVAKNLGSDSLQRWIEIDLGLICRRHASHKGFRILAVTQPD
ncbi:MAG: methyltransferase [Actinomycetia bacterium]|nr:methyltransferase [Actinomycetes bacterium]